MLTSRSQACRILGLGDFATEGEIKSAYKRLVKLYHPDERGENAEYYRVVEAYEYLSANPIDVYNANAFGHAPVHSPRILGQPGNSRQREEDRAAYLKWDRQQKERKAQAFEQRVKNYNDKLMKEEEEYKRAMDAINNILIAEAIKKMIRDNPKPSDPSKESE